jgi:hypothetical protein
MTQQIVGYRLQGAEYELTVEPYQDEWRGSVRMGTGRILARINRQATLEEAQAETCRQAKAEGRLRGFEFDACAQGLWQPVTLFR